MIVFKIFIYAFLASGPITLFYCEKPFLGVIVLLCFSFVPIGLSGYDTYDTQELRKIKKWKKRLIELEKELKKENAKLKNDIR